MSKEADFRWVDKSMPVEEVLATTARPFFELIKKDKETAISIIDHYIKYK